MSEYNPTNQSTSNFMTQLQKQSELNKKILLDNLEAK